MRKSILIVCLFLSLIFLIIAWQFHLNKRIISKAPIIKSNGQLQSYVKIAAVADVLCAQQNLGKSCQLGGISKLIDDLDPQAILISGDSQYEKGTYNEFQKYFETFLGKYKKIIYPSPGNHDYYTSKASGYFDYFNGVGKADGRAGLRNQGYYSFNLENWHIISLNSNCEEIGGCQKGSMQEQWLYKDLQKNKQPCTLAFWHEPLFSSGPHGNNRQLRDIWADLYNYKTDVVVNGHDHDYERFKKQDAAGNADENGIREFVVGTGGSLLYRFMNYEKNSEIKNAGSHGILELKLYRDRYEWIFHPVDGDIFKDTGSGLCNLKS